MRAQFEIPVVPMSLNKILRTHWSKRRKEKERLAWAIRAGMQEAGVPLCQPGEKRKVHFTLYFLTNRRRDTDNYLKILLDASNDAGLIYDDNPNALCYSIALDVSKEGIPYTSLIVEWGE